MRVAVVFFNSLKIGQSNPSIRMQIEAVGEDLRRSIGDRRPSDLEPVARIRRLFKSLGIDPTRERPSSERLIRKVLRDLPFSPLNDLVDGLALVSLKMGFPIDAYDWDLVVPPVLVRIGQPDEGYVGSAGETVRLQGRVVLVDGEGPFGSPGWDSRRAAVTRGTVRAFVVAYAPADTPRNLLEETLREIRSIVEEHCGGRVAASGLIPN